MGELLCLALSRIVCLLPACSDLLHAVAFIDVYLSCSGWLQSRKQLDTGGYTEVESITSRSSDDSLSENPTKRVGKDPEERSHTATGSIGKGYGASWLLQYTTLFRRSLKVRRFEALSLQDFAQCICVAVLSGQPPFPAFFSSQHRLRLTYQAA